MDKGPSDIRTGSMLCTNIRLNYLNGLIKLLSMSDLKQGIRKVWHFIWESDSPWSWLLNIALAYVLIKFLTYPGLGLLFHTPFPIVAVVSGSMEHMVIDHEQGPHTICGFPGKLDYYVPFEDYWEICGPWYEQKGIQKEEFAI